MNITINHEWKKPLRRQGPVRASNGDGRTYGVVGIEKASGDLNL